MESACQAAQSHSREEVVFMSGEAREARLRTEGKREDAGGEGTVWARAETHR